MYDIVVSDTQQVVLPESSSVLFAHTHMLASIMFNTHTYHRYSIVSALSENMYWASLYFFVEYYVIIYTHILNCWCFWIISKDLSWTQFDRWGLCENFSIFCCKHKRLFNLSKQ